MNRPACLLDMGDSETARTPLRHDYDRKRYCYLFRNFVEPCMAEAFLSERRADNHYQRETLRKVP